MERQRTDRSVQVLAAAADPSRRRSYRWVLRSLFAFVAWGLIVSGFAQPWYSWNVEVVGQIGGTPRGIVGQDNQGYGYLSIRWRW